MSEENLEVTATDEGQIAPSENAVETENVDAPAKEGEQEVVTETDPEQEIVQKTKKELDADFAKAKRIAERRGKMAAEREIQDRLQQELARVQEQQRQQPQPQNVNTYWDEGLQRNIPGNMTMDEYARSVGGQPSNQPAQPQAPIAQPVQQAQQPMQTQQPQQAERFSQTADDQAIECDEDFPDFQKVLREGMPSVTMVNSASQDPNGIKNLYLKLKEDPTFALQLSRLSPQDQQHRMWQLNQEMANKSSKKVVSKATPQPASIKGGTKIHVNESDMSISELRRLRRDQATEKRRLK